jgi:uroporphyrin-III C-methyltransferase
MKAPAALRAVLCDLPRLQPGSVWLAGAGPGDPGLLTLAVLAALTQADAVVHDALVDPRILALARADAALVFAGKRGGRPSAVQDDITDRLIALARAGRRVLRLKGGDPCVFGRGGEEALALARAGVPFRLLPGITAGLAGLAAAAIPATLRGVNQAIVLATGHDPEGGALDWAALARLGQPIVLYMARRSAGAIAREMLAGGVDPDLPAAVIAAATTPRQRVAITTLRDLPAATATVPAAEPAIIVIGRIVAAREELAALLPVARERLAWLLPA